MPEQLSKSGLLCLTSPFDVEQTCSKVTAAMGGIGFQPVFTVDHAAAAATHGIVMPATRVLFFGNPAAGTPLMLSTPALAIDLPARILVAQDASGKVKVSWIDPSFLQQRHGIAVPPLAAIGDALAKALA